MPEDAIELAIKALRETMTATEERINELEDELRDKRAQRTNIGRGLVALDPTWAAARPKAKAKRRSDGSYPISNEKIEALISYLREHHADGAPFIGSDLPLKEIGMSNASRYAALSELARRGNLRVDRRGGHGQATGYAIARLPDE